jgi:TolA-binding protein
MDEDPRLASGARPLGSDKVLDFIQMTGLTTGRMPEANAVAVAGPYGRPDDPISFFEYGVRDVDGSGDPAEAAQPEFDIDAFKPGRPAIVLEESRSLAELKQIIAELAEETNPARATYVRLTTPDPPREAPPPAREMEGLAARSPEPARAQPAPVAASPEARAVAPQTHAPAAGLAAARDLVRELSQANEVAAERQRAVKSLTLELKHPVTTAREELPEPEPEKEDFSSHSHLGLPRRRHRSVLRRWLPRIAVAVIVAACGYGAYEMLKSGARSPRAAYRSAQALLDSGEHRAASNEFLSFSKRFEGHPLAPDALFMAGYALQLEPPAPPARAKEAYAEAIGIFEKFTRQFPAHEKTPRAETLMGLLYYKTGRYLEAINLLGDPDRRLRDPGAYLMALRTLGRAYVDVGQLDNARSAFLRAAALESNMTPDQDYVELATTYQDLGARTGDPAQRRRYFGQAVEQWDFAMQVPGLLKGRKDDIKLLRDAAASRLDPGAQTINSGDGSAAAGETPPADSSSVRAPKQD